MSQKVKINRGSDGRKVWRERDEGGKMKGGNGAGEIRDGGKVMGEGCGEMRIKNQARAQVLPLKTNLRTQVVWEGYTQDPPPPQVSGAFLGSPPHPAVISGSSLEPLASHVVPPYWVSVPPRPTGWGLTKPFCSSSKLGQWGAQLSVTPGRLGVLSTLHQLFLWGGWKAFAKS